jgi:hypothetical protein
LYFSLPGGCTVREYLENDLGPVNHFSIEFRLEVVPLASLQFFIEDDILRASCPEQIFNIAYNLLPDQGAEIGPARARIDFADHFDAERFHEQGELREAVVIAAPHFAKLHAHYYCLVSSFAFFHEFKPSNMLSHTLYRNPGETKIGKIFSLALDNIT